MNNGRLFGVHVMKSKIVTNTEQDNEDEEDDDKNDDKIKVKASVFLNTDRIYLWFAHMASATIVDDVFSSLRVNLQQRRLPNGGVILLEGLVAERVFETCSQSIGCLTFTCSPHRRDCLLAKGYITLQNVRDREVGVYWFTKIHALGMIVDDVETIGWREIFKSCMASWTLSASASCTVCYGSQTVLGDNCQFTGRVINWCRQLSIWNIVEQEEQQEKEQRRKETKPRTTRNVRTVELI